MMAAASDATARVSTCRITNAATTTSLVSGITYSALLRYWRGLPWWGLVWLAAPPILLASATALALQAMKRRNRDLMDGPTGKARLSENATQRDAGGGPSHARLSW